MTIFSLSRPPSAPALIFEERAITFDELSRVAGELASIEPEPGEVAAFVASPRPAPLTFALSMIALGRPFLPLHPRATEADVRRSVGAFDGARFLDPAEAIERTSGRAPALQRDAPVDDERLLAALETSGTTRTPRAVLLSRRAFAASARASAANIAFQEKDRWLLAMPFSHAGGLSILTRCLAAGRAVVVHEGFDPTRVVASIAAQGVTMLSAVPSMLSALLEADPQGHLARLRLVLLGGAACSPALYEAAIARGITLLSTYGLTEACSQVTTQRITEPASRTARDSGFPLAGTRVRVVDGDGRDLVETEGRIHIAGPTLFSGYHGEPGRRTDDTLDTGDLGVLDRSGRLHVSGRADDLIVTGGENVSPRAVEAGLRSIPGVRDAFAIGLPDARWGAIVGALVVLDHGCSIEQVVAACADQFSTHARPRVFRSVESLPVGRTGKPDRAAARGLLETPSSGHSKS